MLRMRSQRGTAYVEYFIAASWMAAVTWILWDNLDRSEPDPKASITETYDATFQQQMNDIAGPL